MSSFKMTNSELFAKARELMPGGVNSPARAFKAVGGDPPFFERAEGAYLYDCEEKRYIDYIGSWGPMILGHSHPDIVEAVRKQAELAMSYGAPTELEVIMAEMVINMVPSVEMVRFVNSGTEATMSAVRLARAYTKRDLIVKFEGCYHGHGDAFLSKAGSGMATLGEPTSPGVPKAVAAATLNAQFNDIDSVKQLFETHPEQIAGVIVEPVVGNMGCVPPGEGFLEGLREACSRHGAVLIFDEVMTGFRLSQGGAQELYGVLPDISTLGKVIGGGLPVGAYGGRREIMEMVSPVGPMYQAGTLSGNPLAMAAGIAQLEYLRTYPGVYMKLETDGEVLESAVREHVQKKSYPVSFNRVGSMATVFFTEKKVVSWAESSASDTKKFARYFHFLLEHGIYMPPAQFEAYFHSNAHSDDDIGETADLMCQALDHAFS